MAKAARCDPISEISLSVGPSVQHFTQLKFQRETSHIALMFLRHLRDVRQYILDGSEILFVYFGIPESHRELLGKTNYYRVPQGVWSVCCVPRFDLQGFFAKPEPKQDEQMTSLLEKVLRNVARQVCADEQPIREAAKLIREGNYTARFPVEQLMCQSPQQDRTARVWSHVSRGMIRWLVEIHNAAGELIRSEWIPEECYRQQDFSESGLQPRWDKRGFALRNAKGRVRYTLPPEK